MATSEIVKPNGVTHGPSVAPMPDIMEAVIMAGDLAKLSPSQRIAYYGSVCQSLGLNPLTKPFDYINLNGKLTLYASKGCTDQLRARDGISINIVGRDVIEGVYVVTAKAATASGRVDESTGAVPIESLKGEAKANAFMKAETKAKRRVTLSLCGLGILDETELDSVPNARRVTVDMSTGQIEAAPDTGGHAIGTQAAADHVAQSKLADLKRAAPPKPVEAVPEEFQSMWAMMQDIKSTVAVFQNLKNSLCDQIGQDSGARMYYGILGKYGVEHANQFKSTKPARNAARELLEAIRLAQTPAVATDDDIPDFGPDPGEVQ